MESDSTAVNSINANSLEELKPACVSFWNTPAIQCPNRALPNSVFCRPHADKFYKAYREYKNLEKELLPITEGKGPNFYLKEYVKYSKAHSKRFEFREKAIAYSAKDIGHQIRLGWLWDQIQLCVNYLTLIFDKIPKNPTGETRKIPKNSKTSSEETEQIKSPVASDQIDQIGEKKKTEYNRIFKKYVATQKKVEDYEKAIQEALKSDQEAVQQKIQKYCNLLEKYLGSKFFDEDRLIILGRIMGCYYEICDPKKDYEHQKQLQIVTFPFDETLAEKLVYSKIGFQAIVRDYGESLVADEISFWNQDKLSPEKQSAWKKWFDNVGYLTRVIIEIEASGRAILYSPKLIRLIDKPSICYFIFSKGYFLLELHLDKLFRVHQRHDPALAFSIKQVTGFNADKFIAVDGDLKKLLIMYHQNTQLHKTQPKPCDIILELDLITNYYTQAIATRLAFSYLLPDDRAIQSLKQISDDLKKLDGNFKFEKIVLLQQTYNQSGCFRQIIADFSSKLSKI